VPPSVVRQQPDDPLPFPRSALAGDLDAIVLKALHNDPLQRYSSASDLAHDIGRFLQGKAVLAQPDRALYRARKFVRRHRAAAVGVSAAILSLVIGLAVAVWQADVARGERDRAQLETAKAQQVSSFLRALFTSNAPLEALGRKITAEELLKNGVERIDRELSGQPDVQASMLATLGSVYAEMSHHQQDALPLVERSLALRERLFGTEHVEVAESLFILGRLKSRGFADYAAAEQLLKRAIGIRERLVGPADPALAPVLSELGMALWRTGTYDEGQTALRRAVAIGERTDEPELHKWLANLALLDQLLGDFDSAEQLLRRAFALGVKAEGRPGVPVGPTMLNLGSLLRAQEKFAEARQVLEDLNADEERTWGTSRMYTLGELGDLYFAMGEQRLARDVLDRAIAIGELERDIPEPPDLARSLTYSGRLYLIEGKPREARATLERALRIRERFLGATHQDVAETLLEVARAQAALEGYEVAEPLLRRALAIQRQALVPGHRLLVPTLVTLGEIVGARGQTGESRALLREAVDIAQRRLPQHHSERRRAEDALRRMSE
jgi:tetratricopeptide (TPR) repeat protein